MKHSDYSNMALRLLFVLSGVLTSYHMIKYSMSWLNEGDTGALITYSGELLTCIREGTWPGCRAAGPFPILQYIPVIILKMVGIERGLIFKFLGLVSSLAFTGSVILFLYYFFSTRRKDIGLLGLVCLLSSPLMAYARSTFGEMTAAFLTLLFVVLVLKKAPWWAVAATSMLICLSKDIAVVFLPLLGAGAVFSYYRDDKAKAISSLAGMATGCVAGASVVMFVNYFRSGKLYNALYTLDFYIVPDIKNTVSFIFGQWLAPNVGMVFFWTSFCFLATTVFFARIRLKKLLTVSSFPLFLTFLILLGMTLGLARWWAPFGWVAWGPRLMLPWIPAITLLIMNAYTTEVRMLFHAAKKYKKSLFLVCALLSASGLAQFYVISDPHKYSNQVVEPAPPHCPKMAIIEHDQNYYYKCMGYRMWAPKLLILPRVIGENSTSGRMLWGLMYLVFVSGLVVRARKFYFSAANTSHSPEF